MTELCAVQGFLQRVQNYLQKCLVNLLVRRQLTLNQDKFVKESGHSFTTHETGMSTSAASIVVTDWALEVPQPMPPALHVRSSSSSFPPHPSPSCLHFPTLPSLPAAYATGPFCVS